MTSRQPHVPATRPTSGAHERFRLLDGLRFVAALAVVCFHFTARENDAWGAPVERVFPTLSSFSVYGTLGVEFFFIISGFVILMTAWDRSVAGYTASRIARLFPGYWVAVTLSAILLIVIWPEGRNVDLGKALVNLTMMQDAFHVGRVEGVYWTLWAELRFYVIIGLFMVVGITRARLLAFCALWPLVAGALGTADSAILKTVLIPQYAPLFAGGMMLFYITREGHSLLAWLIVGANAVLGAHLADEGAVGRIDANTAYTHDRVVVWVVVLACFGVVSLASLTRLRDVSWRWLTTIGALTYPLYLIHEFWGRWFTGLLVDHLPKHAVLPLAIGFCLAMAFCINRFVERPFAPRLRRDVQRTIEGAVQAEKAASEGPVTGGRGTLTGSRAGSQPAPALGRTSSHPGHPPEDTRAHELPPVTRPVAVGSQTVGGPVLSGR